MPVGRGVPTLIAPRRALSRGEMGREGDRDKSLGWGVLVVAGSGGRGGPSHIPQGPPLGSPQERASREEGSPPTVLPPWAERTAYTPHL